jgi:hypothetical protein
MPRDFLQGARSGQRCLLQPPVHLLDFVQASLKRIDPLGKAAQLLRNQFRIVQRAAVMCQPVRSISTSVTRQDDPPRSKTSPTSNIRMEPISATSVPSGKWIVCRPDSIIKRSVAQARGSGRRCARLPKRADGPFSPLRLVWLGPILLLLTELDLRSWFADNELEPCPRCNQTSALPTPHGGLLVCLECGLIDAEGKRVDDLPPSAGSLSRLPVKGPAERE